MRELTGGRTTGNLKASFNGWVESISGDLVLEDLLEHQPSRQAHHLLQNPGNRPTRTEQIIDLGTDRISRRYL